jgi:hypothetical protein
MYPAQPGRLDSWKAIAEYLGRNVRTATRWAEERGMPVHRVPGGKRGAVFAFTGEIDAWLISQRDGTAHENHPANGVGQSAPDSKSPDSGDLIRCETPAIHDREHVQDSAPLMKQLFTSNWLRFALMLAAVFIAGVPIARILRPTSGQASELFSVKLQTNALEGVDAEGRSVWKYPYAQPLRTDRFRGLPRPYQPAVVADFFHDGSKEAAVTVILRSGPNVADEDRDQVDFFSGNGKRLWSYVPHGTFQFGSYTLGGSWKLHDLFSSAEASETRLWAAACHHTFGDAFIVQLDPRTGTDTLRFVNTGTVYRMNEIKTPDGRFLLVGGFNNEWDSGSLAIINEDRPFAASPQTPGSRHHCDSCPPGDADYYFVFPRSEVNRASGIYEDPVIDILVHDDGIEVVKLERLDEGRETVISFLDTKPPFKLLGRLYNSEYNMLHKTWSAQGKLTHLLENCPERAHPQPVRMWTPAGGWTEIAVKSAEANQ